MLYQALLPFRPASVVSQLGAESNLPLLNGRQLLSPSAERSFPLWVPNIPHPAVMPGVLRAAAHQKALVGLSLAIESSDPAELKRESSPERFFRSVVEAAKETGGPPPLLLHVEEPPVERPGGDAFEAVRDHITKCLDTGFTSFGVDLTACQEADCPGIASLLLDPVLEVELCVVVYLKAAAGVEVHQQADSLAATIASLKQNGVDPDLVVLPGPDALGEEAWELLKRLAQLIAPSGVGWRDPDRANSHHQSERMSHSGLRALIGGRRLYPLIGGGAGKADPQRLEALAYMEALEVFADLGGRGSAPLLVKALGKP